MHEIRIGNNSLYLKDRHVYMILFFCVSGIGFAGASFMILLDMIRWSLQ